MVNEFSYLDKQTVTIASGSSLSGAIALSRYGVARIYVPSGWTAANLTFQVSEDGGSYANLYDSGGNEVTVTAAASQAITLDPTVFGLGFQYLKIRSGTSASAVTQGSDRILTLAVRPL